MVKVDDQLIHIYDWWCIDDDYNDEEDDDDDDDAAAADDDNNDGGGSSSCNDDGSDEDFYDNVRTPTGNNYVNVPNGRPLTALIPILY